MFIAAEVGQRAALEPINVNQVYVDLHTSQKLSRYGSSDHGVMGGPSYLWTLSLAENYLVIN